YMTEQNRKAPLTAPNFCMLLRKYIGGGHLLSVSQPGLERVIELEIERRDEMGDLRRWKLIAEIMGKHSNLILVNEENRIVDAIKHIPSSVSSVREVLPGREWFIPNTAGKSDPLSAAPELLADRITESGKPLYKAIYSSLTGFSPSMAEEVCFRASLDGARQASSFSGTEKYRLQEALHSVMGTVKQKDFHPCMILQSKMPLEFSAVKMKIYEDHPVLPYDSPSVLTEAFFREKERQTRIRQKSADLRHIVQTALERQVRTLSLQEKQMKDTEKKDICRLYGELLYTWGYSIPAGEKQAELDNYHDGTRITVPLDPQLSAASNAEKYYARYTKLKRTAEALHVRMNETRTALSYLETVLQSLESASDEGDLSQIRQELIDSGYIRKTKQNQKKRIPSGEPLHFRSSDGFEIWVGKNNYQNEEVSFRIASGEDWWFHAKKIPGSHVILKSAGREVPDRAFEEAASLAAYYSKGKLAPKVEIDYTLRKNLRKPSGAQPGFVVYYTNYSMMAEPVVAGPVQLGNSY
ncbi:MAG: fibronectin/fibrinogen-binding protein, partial [Eubacterium sp.]|nr:fibronectin/fibrinogen-binding protein [Eubacterium sp.]